MMHPPPTVRSTGLKPNCVVPIRYSLSVSSLAILNGAAHGQTTSEHKAADKHAAGDYALNTDEG